MKYLFYFQNKMETADGRRTGTSRRGRKLRRLPKIVRCSTVRLLVPTSVGTQCSTQCRRHILQAGRGRCGSHSPETPPLPLVPSGNEPNHARSQCPLGDAGRQQFLDIPVLLLHESGARRDGGAVPESRHPTGPGIAGNRRQEIADQRRRRHNPCIDAQRTVCSVICNCDNTRTCIIVGRRTVI